ncbi:EAL domain-containing protein [Methylobacterium sp. yr668]|uniref:putative bifunctional diguanylate cyclase/phosphodiesterase n=1 Tax=Methylobacterium sp. yr668 TaxID=1761801 RepID=UPI0008EE4A34|nr:EAL domain-containing protein [Methylobacterium sp. yr668]SFS97391.1 PAS domain S-box-containing protein/diguanylate cyclase (GGDEF) domain-containing protein [Methylobacterium sp. yr668]
MNNWGGSVSAQHDDGQTGKNLLRHWQDCRTPGAPIPSYEAVVLGSLGRLADRAALVTTRDGRAARILWAGQVFGAWLAQGAEGAEGSLSGIVPAEIIPTETLPVDALPIELREPVDEMVAAALTSGQPAYARCDRLAAGVVTSTRLVGVPLGNRWGEPFVLVGFDGASVRTELVQAMFTATDQGILALSTVRDAAGRPVDFKIVALNRGAERLLERPAAALQWQRVGQLFPGAVTARTIATLAAMVERGGRAAFELSRPRSDGGTLYLKVEAGCVGDLVSVTMTDVGDIKAREASFRLLFENNPVPMWVVADARDRFLAVNDAAVAHYGYSREQFLERAPADLAMAADAAPAPGLPPTGTLHRRADGSAIEVSLFQRAMPFEGRQAVLEAAIDMTERRRAEARIAHMAHHDALTGLPNRVLFRDRLAEAIARHARDGEAAVLLCLDLDKFKIVNDTLGHPVGDALLREAAERIAGCLREDDLVARLGGDEFAILVRGPDLPALADGLVARVIAELGRPFRLDGQDCHIGTSIGVACLPRDGTDPETLMKNADLALYRAKAEGGGTFRCFEPEMDAWVQARRRRENELREAFARGQFSLVYQPLMDARAGRILAFEALLRWHHPEHGPVSPAEFVPLAEETGLIVPIGAWVMQTAFAEAATWPEAIRLAVNLSPIQFRNRDLVETVRGALSAAGLDPRRLELEITESVLLADSAANLATLHALRAMGIRIAMDDFGTGYSSLGYLRSFPFDKIKLDRSFVSQVGENTHCTAIVRAVASLGTSLGIATTAEGVETAEQLAMLRAEGYDEVQGFLFSRAVPGPEARRLIERAREAVPDDRAA